MQTCLQDLKKRRRRKKKKVLSSYTILYAPVTWTAGGPSACHGGSQYWTLPSICSLAVPWPDTLYFPVICQDSHSLQMSRHMHNYSGIVPNSSFLLMHPHTQTKTRNNPLEKKNRPKPGPGNSICGSKHFERSSYLSLLSLSR